MTQLTLLGAESLGRLSTLYSRVFDQSISDAGTTTRVLLQAHSELLLNLLRRYLWILFRNLKLLNLCVLGHNLVNLSLECVQLSVVNLNPMPMLTSLILRYTTIEDENLYEFNKCFPNLQLLKLAHVEGLKDPKIRLLNLKICICDFFDVLHSFSLITPNLITLKIHYGFMPDALHVEAPMLSHFHLSITNTTCTEALTVEKFDNLKTLWLDSRYFSFLLSAFPLTKTVEILTLDSVYRVGTLREDTTDTKLVLGKVFTVFPNVSSLCIGSVPWSDLELSLNPEALEILDGMEGLKTISIYLKLLDSSLTFSSIACVLDKCIGLSEVSLIIHTDVDNTISECFMSKCMARWPRLKWRWGVWSGKIEDTWITNAISN